MKREVNSPEVAGKIAEIEEELKRLGLWQDGPLREEQYEFRQAFAADTMTFTQWLQFVLVPKVKGIIEAGGEFPARSEVGAKAFREFVMWPAYGDLDTERLLRLLDEFDALFGR
ncbi:MAG TPA: YqcC family protein [Pyrinomonadaceae bacterium]|jgi:uncharacterized protein YqcC (DUF446 family)|nr:YqcC family protein [Pyrinomonadaceae bacterium]